MSHVPSLVFEQKYPCGKFISLGTGIPLNPKECLPQAGSSLPGHTPVAEGQTLCLWLLGRRKGKSWANTPGAAPYVVPPATVPLEAPCTQGPVLDLQGCCDFCCAKAAGADNKHNELLIPSVSRAFWVWWLFKSGFMFWAFINPGKGLWKPGLPLQANVVSVQQLEPGQWSDLAVWVFF